MTAGGVDPAVARRLERLEREVDALRVEVARLRDGDEPVRAPAPAEPVSRPLPPR